MLMAGPHVGGLWLRGARASMSARSGMAVTVHTWQRRTGGSITTDATCGCHRCCSGAVCGNGGGWWFIAVAKRSVVSQQVCSLSPQWSLAGLTINVDCGAVLANVVLAALHTLRSGVRKSCASKCVGLTGREYLRAGHPGTVHGAIGELCSSPHWSCTHNVQQPWVRASPGSECRALNKERGTL